MIMLITGIADRSGVPEGFSAFCCMSKLGRQVIEGGGVR